MTYNLFETIEVWWHGQLQQVLLALPYVKPEREGNKAPAWFRDVYPSWYWAHFLDDDQRPTVTWIKNYRYASERLVETWLERLRGRAVSDAFAMVVGLTGRPKAGYYTLADWLDAAWYRVTTWLPDWIQALAVDLAAVPGNLQAWAQARYDAALAQVAMLWTWLHTTGSILSAFYDTTHTWIASFIQNPAGVILGVLGSTWTRLVTFDQGALSYFYDLWGLYRQTLADFIADPLGFLYDRAEQFMLDKW